MIEDADKSQAELIIELQTLRRRLDELERLVSPGADAQSSQLRLFLQDMPVMVLAYNEALTRVVVWNRECERVTGFSAAEIVGNPDASLLLYPDDAYRDKLFRTWLEMGDNYRDIEWKLACKDGSLRTISWSNISAQYPIPGWGTWAIGIDVTARKQAEQALQAAHDELEQRVQDRTAALAESNERLEIEIAERLLVERALRESEIRLRNVLENMPVMLVAWDDNADTIQVWNRECERVTGYSALEIVGKPALEVNQLVYPDKEYLRRLWLEMEQRGDNYRNWEWDWRAKDGEFRTIAWSNISAAFPIPGWATWAIGIDVTERRKAQQRAIDLAVEHERLQILEQFIGDASHDLRTPLMTMKLSLTVIRRSDDPTHRLRHLDILDTQVLHLERVLEDLLNIVRLEQEAALISCPFDLNAMLGGVVEEHRVLAERQQHDLRLAREPGALIVPGDRDEVARAVANLVVNAISYTPEGGTITVHSERRQAEAVVEVQDSGIGISEAELPHIFKRFYRADRARSTNTGGMGLGLAITRKIIEAHGGSVTVSSEPGHGSLFRVILPLVAGSDQQAEGRE
ncbi:MAG: PAS domain S-box protein [Anaerolineae bacterium]|nr:PAS domain S-box protein [Anaerolineae bacterium]